MKKYVLILLLYIITMLLGLAVKLQDLKIKQLEYKIENVSVQVQESEERCRRMTETNLDIIMNQRWENDQ